MSVLHSSEVLTAVFLESYRRQARVRNVGARDVGTAPAMYKPEAAGGRETHVVPALAAQWSL